MAAKSKHWADVATWLYNVIDSCETPMQIINTRKLVILFSRRYCITDSFSGPIMTTYESLLNYNDEKLNTLLKRTNNEEGRSNCSDGDID